MKFNKGKRAQAAMEFIMTYGWAILVVLAAIAALAYFGVLSPTKFLPEKCTMPSGIPCIDSTTTTSGITLVLQNSAGFDMSGVSVSLTGTGCTGTAAGPSSLNNGDKGTYTVSCVLTSGTQYKGSINVSYTNLNSGVAHDATGEIINTV